jgi:hypothetical protein
MPNIDINGTIVSFPDTMNEKELQAASRKAYARMKPSEPNLDIGLRTMTSSFNPGPAMPIPSGIQRIPYTTGQEAGAAVSEKLSEEIGKRGYPKTGAAIGTAAYTIPTAAQAMMTPDLPVPAWVGKAAGAVGRGGAKFLEKVLPSIKAESTISAFTKPLSLFKAPYKKEVSEAYAKSEFPEIMEGFKEKADKALSGPAKFARKAVKEVENFMYGEKANPKTIIQGRQALQKQIADLTNKIENTKDMAAQSIFKTEKYLKTELYKDFNSVLDELVPKFRKADVIKTAQSAVEPFRKAFLPGQIRFTPEGIARMAPGLPYGIGLGVSGAGGLAKATSGAIKKSPKIATVISEIMKKNRKKNEDINP